MDRLTLTKEEDYTPGIDDWHSFDRYKPENNQMCAVQFILHNYNVSYTEYELRFFEDCDVCIQNWIDVKRWKYLWE